MSQTKQNKGAYMQFKPRLKIWQGSNRKNTFNPETFEARSYQHWCYMTKIKGHIVFNDYSYSVTTNGHQGEMRGFMRETLGINMDKVVFVNQRQSLTSGLFLDHHYETMALAEVRIKNSNRPAFIESQKEIIAKCKKEIAILKKLGARADMTLVNHRVNAKQRETSRLERQRAKSKAARDARKAVVTEFQGAYESTKAVEV